MRVELGEVEATLRRAPGVADSVVLAEQDESGSLRLAAFVTPQTAEPERNELAAAARTFARNELPPHMVPAEVVVLDAFPVNGSGKVDRRALAALPRPTLEMAPDGAPRDELERTLLELWRKALNSPSIGIHDDFFERGGHSLLALQLFAAIEQSLGVKPPLQTIFRAPTVAQFAEELRREGVREVWSPLVPIQPKGDRPPFFCVHGLGGGIMGYLPLARYLGSSQPFYGLQAYGTEAEQAPDHTIEAMAERYVTAVRAAQPEGPYRVGGYSYGAVVAYEMARQLADAGQRVALLAVFDQPAPTPDYYRVRLNGQFLRGLARNLPVWTRDYLSVGARQQWGRIVRQARVRLRREAPPIASDDDLDLRDFVDDVRVIPAEQRAIMRTELAAWFKYKPLPYPGAVTIIRTPREPLWCSYDPALGWHALAKGGVEIHLIPGAHRNLTSEPHVAALARELEEALAASR